MSKRQIVCNSLIYILNRYVQIVFLLNILNIIFITDGRDLKTSHKI